jgi:Tfp pilus assembly protein FimT
MHNPFSRKSRSRAFRLGFDQRDARRRLTHHFGQVQDFGFSLIELMVVVGIVITLSAVALPTLFNVVASSHLRGSMNDLAGLFQNARNIAVRTNTISRVRFQVASGTCFAYVDNGASPTGLTSMVPQISLPRQFTKVDPPSGGGAPTALTATDCGANSLTTLDTTDDTYFSAVGLPCQYSSGSCSGTQAFAYYFNYAGSSGGTRWTSICVSPAGRMTTWYWNGNTWTN